VAVALAGTLAIALLPTASAGAFAASRYRPPSASAAGAPRYCNSPARPRGCIKVPKSAERPHSTPEQSPTSQKGASDSGGLGSGPGVREPAAVDWAEGQRGTTAYAFYDESFVEEAYGTTGQYRTAWDAAQAIGLHHGSVESAPAGALVFFAPNSINPYGHVGISIGNGAMISALSTVQTTNVGASRYWSNLYRGWALAPTSWPGRIPAPPGGSDQPLRDSAIQITSPAVGSTVSGAINLIADAVNVNGVAFFAYYATNPANQGTIGWHLLGDATDSSAGWTLPVSTTVIPSQGNPAWGTVNIAAVALSAAGAPTGTRDYRRISLDNSGGVAAPITTTTTTTTTSTSTTSAATAPPTTYAETAGGVANTYTDYQDAPPANDDAPPTEGISIAAQQTVQITCKTAGFQVADGNPWWYEIASSSWNNQYYVSADSFYNNGQTSGSLQGTPFVDPAVPNC
jgi:hypothetical protein